MMSALNSPSASSSTSESQSISSVNLTQNSLYLMQLLSIDVSKAVIDYVVDYVSHIVGHPVDHPSDEPIILFPMTRGRSQSRRHRRPAKISPCSDATSFVERVLHKARVKISEVLATLAYIDRARPYLQISSDTKYPFERVLLGALIIATKFLNDSCIPNMHWAQCSRLFGKHDIGRIEREFLEVLDWDLTLTEEDLLVHYDSLILINFPEAPDITPSSIQYPKSVACPHNEEEKNAGLCSSSPLSFPYQRSETTLPTRLPLITGVQVGSSFSPTVSLPSSVPLSPSTPDLELDSAHSSFDTDIESSSSPLLLTPPSSGLSLDGDEDNRSGGRKSSDSFWYTYFANMRIQEASSPIVRLQKPGNI
ncbi:MAG: hypothetical protein NXY57DRAFT_998140 [Lentinula lateritia]|uniref:Cyclin N-terminal domain-containing protein n=1 Tax=Lentinula lateritia TaxID=40482 RepID=A0ABQ8VKU2_9AGAR|nr:MAG: hypothetical protein NXY57DRAFT_998140 [Lentinula lateritia]KAJ4494346.1 hypothetical protein C8R41DRAFT_829803 [Lentinula lateritia]